MLDKGAIIKEVQKQLAKGQIGKAIVELEKLVHEAPDSNTFNTIGDLYLRKGDKRSAINCFHKAAQFFRAGGFSLKALALYKKINNIEPADPDALIALGELSEEKDLVTDAIKYYLAATDLIAKGPQREKEKGKFVAVYEKILLLAPLNLPLREKIAGLFLKEGFVHNAAKEYLYIAKLYEEKGDSDQARYYLSKAIDAQPDNRDALSSLSALYEAAGNVQKAVELLKEALRTNQNDVGLLRQCASLLQKSGTYDEASALLEKARELSPADLDLSRQLGDVLLRKGDREKAWELNKTVIDHLVREEKTVEALELAEQFKELFPVEVGTVLISLYKQKDDLEKVFEETLRIAPILIERGLKDEGIAHYREALKIHPEDAHLKGILADLGVQTEPPPAAPAQEKSIEDLVADAEIFINYQLFDEALAILEDLEERAPENVGVHSCLKKIYRETDASVKAVTECLILAELFERAGEPDQKDAVLLEARSLLPDDPRILKLFGKPEEAASFLETEEAAPPAIEDFSDDIAEAEFCARQGLKEDALRIYQKLLELFPGNRELLEKLEALGESETEAVMGTADAPTESSTTISADYTPSPEPESEEVDAIHDHAEVTLDSDVLDIFEEFKKGLEKELDDEDSETHYNLGIAYKEMGLIDDAIKEFQLSRKDPDSFIRSMTMLGVCYMEKSLFPLAIEAFKESLNKITTRDEAYWGAKYDLASAFEMNNNLEEAIEIFSEIYGWDSSFRKVNEKLNQLRTLIPKDDPQTKQKRDRVSYL